MNIGTKITFLYTTLTAVIALLLSIFIYHFTAIYVENDFFHRMQVRAGIAAQANIEGNDVNVSFYKEIREKHLQHLPEETVYIFASEKIHMYMDSLRISVPAFFYENYYRSGKAQFQQENLYYVATSYAFNGIKYSILLSAINQEGQELLSDLRRNLISGFILSVSVVLICSLLLSQELIKPIRSLTKNAKKITATNLHLRLPTKEAKDEISDLTRTFNDMLDRLETSFETQNNFLNKAAHELRTPLTAIIGEAELALSKPRQPEEYQQALRIISRESEQLQHHTSSLLELAQAGYNSKEAFMSEMRLDELLFSVKRLIDFTEPGNKVEMNLDALPETENMITIIGNVNLLKLALANIIQNACKYSGHKKVAVTLTTSAAYCIIKVKDEGIGIPDKELKYIFDPFFRASNTSDFKGYGVGLPLAQKIIRLHRGNLEYSSQQDVGTTVEISLPYVPN